MIHPDKLLKVLENTKVFFTAPEPFQESLHSTLRVFLGGAIDMGEAEDWQGKVTRRIEEVLRREQVLPTNQVLSVYNPRRKDWDPTWGQNIKDARFYQQVDWELRAMEAATHIVIYLPSQSKAPISLLEIGLWARSGKLTIVAEHGFHRRGNLEVISERYNIPLYNHLETWVSKVLNSYLKEEDKRRNKALICM